MSKEGAELRRLSESIDALSLKSDAEEYGKIMDALANKNDNFTRLAEETQTHVSHITEVMQKGLNELGCTVESADAHINSSDLQYQYKGRTYNLTIKIDEVK
jgi:hypothetical protein